MSKYTGVEIASLTIEDALADADWGRKPIDYLKYVAVEMPVWQGITEGDFDLDTWWEYGMAVAYYVARGTAPDYAQIHDSGVKQAVRSTILSFNARLDSEYLRHYRQYVTAVQRNEKKKTLEVT